MPPPAATAPSAPASNTSASICSKSLSSISAGVSAGPSIDLRLGIVLAPRRTHYRFRFFAALFLPFVKVYHLALVPSFSLQALPAFTFIPNTLATLPAAVDDLNLRCICYTFWIPLAFMYVMIPITTAESMGTYRADTDGG
jgi:hypothetical protein